MHPISAPSITAQQLPSLLHAHDGIKEPLLSNLLTNNSQVRHGVSRGRPLEVHPATVHPRVVGRNGEYLEHAQQRRRRRRRRRLGRWCSVVEVEPRSSAKHVIVRPMFCRLGRTRTVDAVVVAPITVSAASVVRSAEVVAASQRQYFCKGVCDDRENNFGRVARM